MYGEINYFSLKISWELETKQIAKGFSKKCVFNLLNQKKILLITFYYVFIKKELKKVFKIFKLIFCYYISFTVPRQALST